MTQQQALTSEIIASIASDIKEITPKQTPRREVDLLIKGLASHIREAQARGVTYEEISAKIAEKYPIKQSTLRSAMQQFNKHDPNTRRKKRCRTERGASNNSSATPPSP